MAFHDKGKYIIDPEYMYYFCCGNNWLKGTNKAVMGLTLNKNTLSNYLINIPSLLDQKKIISKLNQISEVIENRQQALTLLDELVKSRFVEMFGDPVINTKHWEKHRLSEFINFLTSGSRGWAKYFSDDGELFITIKNVKNGRISIDDVQHIQPPDNAEAKRTKVQAGDLLISITADLGRTGVVTQEIADYGAYINQHLTCIRLDTQNVIPEYVSAFMESEAGKRQFNAKNQNGVKAGLNFEAINSLELLVPPKELQQKYINFISQIDVTKTAVQRQLDELQTLRAKLMQDYFG